MYYLKLKRILDAVVALLGLLLAAPLFILVALAIRLDSAGPAFFSQKRLSRNGRMFRMYKFRTMRVGAERQGTGLFNYKNDPRVTKVGRFLRNTSLDEFPQLYNVLKGDMTLVGPRPPVWYELGDYATLNRTYRKRFEVLPGMTGLAQVHGRNDLPWQEKVVFDNRYVDLIKKKGLMLDLSILFRTFVSCFSSKSVYEQETGETDESVIARAHADENDTDNGENNG